MASTLLRCAVRLSISPPSPLLRHRLGPFHTSLGFHISSPSIPSSRRVSESVKRLHSQLLFRFASASAKPTVSVDEQLLEVLDSEIDCAQQNVDGGKALDLPVEFPFDIIDNPGNQAITLKREFSGEKIQVQVFIYLDVVGDGEDDKEDGEDGNKDGEGDNSSKVNVSLIAMVEKGEGPALEFCCNLTADGFHIESVLIKGNDNHDDENAYEGPEFSHLDENLQEAFYKYLEERGIKASLFDFLQEFMLRKKEGEYLTWLRTVKKFIEK